MRHGRWLTDLSFATVFQQFSSRLFEWFLGSLLIAPLAALLAGAVMYAVAAVIKKVRFAHATKEGC
jgi:ABC-type Fe3+ transport system permease subunit